MARNWLMRTSHKINTVCTLDLKKILIAFEWFIRNRGHSILSQYQEISQSKHMDGSHG